MKIPTRCPVCHADRIDLVTHHEDALRVARMKCGAKYVICTISGSAEWMIKCPKSPPHSPIEEITHRSAPFGYNDYQLRLVEEDGVYLDKVDELSPDSAKCNGRIITWADYDQVKSYIEDDIDQIQVNGRAILTHESMLNLFIAFRFCEPAISWEVE